MNVPASSNRLNLEDMRRRLGDNDELIADLLGMFLESLPAQLATVKAALEKSEPDEVRRAAHTLKGSASNLSATGIVAASRALEAAAERGDHEHLQRLYERLQVEVEALAAEVSGTPARSE